MKALLQMKNQNPYHFLISFCTVGNLIFLDFYKNAHNFVIFFPILIKKTYEGPSSDEETKLVLILKISYAQWIFFIFSNKNAQHFFFINLDKNTHAGTS